MISAAGRRLLQNWVYVLVRVGDDYLLPYTGAAWEKIAGADYGVGFPAFLERFLGTLNLEGWAAGTYFPAGWYLALREEGRDPEQAEISPAALEKFFQEEMKVDEQGRWSAGEKPVSGRVLSWFQRHLEFDPEPGRYRIRYRVEGRFDVRYLHHHSPPFRVVSTAEVKGGLEVEINNGLKLPLRPDTLRMDRRENLYCAFGPHSVPAWFEPSARWEVLKRTEEEEDCWVLTLRERRWKLALQAPWPFADGLPA